MNNLTFYVFCGVTLLRADIEGSKCHVALSAWRQQASYPCGNFSDTSFETWIFTMTWEVFNDEEKTHCCALPQLWKLDPSTRIDRPEFLLIIICLKNYSQTSLFAFPSTRGFCPLWANLWTPALQFNRFAAPAKKSIWKNSALEGFRTEAWKFDPSRFPRRFF